MKTNPLTFGNYLDDFLHRHKMSQTELAELLNVSRQSVNYWINDKQLLTDVETREKLAELISRKDQKALGSVLYDFHITSKKTREVIDG